MNRIKVKKAQVKPLVEATFPSYKGRTFYVEFVDTITFYDLNWSGGTRNVYKAVSMKDGRIAKVPDPAPWDNPFEGLEVELPHDVVVVCHTHFCGKDMGLRFYANPEKRLALTGG